MTSTSYWFSLLIFTLNSFNEITFLSSAGKELQIIGP